ncbi:hypothetical protein ACS0TY_030163 [Phlomoides rotata]
MKSLTEEEFFDMLVVDWGLEIETEWTKVLALKSIGYKPVAVDGLPFDNYKGMKSCWWFNHHWECLLKGLEFGNPELFITNVFGKYPRLWTLKEVGPNNVRRWYNFRALVSICTIGPSFWEISGLPDWVVNAVQESLSHNPHLKRAGLGSMRKR